VQLNRCIPSAFQSLRHYRLLKVKFCDALILPAILPVLEIGFRIVPVLRMAVGPVINPLLKSVPMVAAML